MHNVFSFKPWFTHQPTGPTIHILLDPCHIVKLVRNLLHDYNEFNSKDGRASWMYIQRLNELQEKIGRRLANKLTSRHILYQQNKMKVI